MNAKEAIFEGIVELLAATDDTEDLGLARETRTWLAQVAFGAVELTSGGARRSPDRAAALHLLRTGLDALRLVVDKYETKEVAQ